MSGRRPTPRGDAKRPSDLAVASVCVALVLLVGLFAWIGYVLTRPEEEETELPAHEAKVTHDSLAPTYTYDGEIIRWYVLVDPDSNVQYLVNDRGGCCVRLDSYGNVMGVSYE